MNGEGGARAPVTVMLAGAGHEAVYYRMQPPVLADPRFLVAGHATRWSQFAEVLETLQPELLLLQADIAPDPEALLALLARLPAWGGVALVVLPPAWADARGAFSRVESVRGVYPDPVNWTELAEAGYGAAATARSLRARAAPLEREAATGFQEGPSYVTGTRRVVFLSHAGGAGVSTAAENLAYELAVRRRVKTLLVSMGLPPAAAPHLGLRYSPHLGAYFDRPGKAALREVLQSREGLEVLLAPDSSLDHLRILEQSARGTGEGSVHGMLLDSEDGRYAAVVMDAPSAENLWMMHALVFANTAVVVARPTLADLSAVRHTLELLLAGVRSEKRLAREAVHLLLNGWGEGAAFTPRLFQEELARAVGWAPPIAAVLPYDPQVPRAQDSGQPPLLRSDPFARGIRTLAGRLFPQLELEPPAQKRPALRLPRLRWG